MGVKNVAFVYPLECCAPYNPASTHITTVKRAVDIKDISRNCMHMEIVGEDGTAQCYVCKFPNKIEIHWKKIKYPSWIKLGFSLFFLLDFQ